MYRVIFQKLFWCGCRVGEVLAIYYKDVDFENCTVSISKTYYRRSKTDYITSPKTVKLELTPIRVHDLRHSHIAFLIEKGVQPLVIAKRVGHDSVNTTMNIYGHLYPDKQK